MHVWIVVPYKPTTIVADTICEETNYPQGQGNPQRQTTQTTLRQRREESASGKSKATLQFESHDPFTYL